MLTLAFAAIATTGEAVEAPDRGRILVVVTSAARMTDGTPTGLWLEEFAVPYERFRKAGYAVDVVSPKGGPAPIDARSNPTPEQAAAWKDATERLKTTTPLADQKADRYAAIFLAGGHGTMFDLPNHPVLGKLLTAFDLAGKPISAVCHGPAAFVGAKGRDGRDILAGRRFTAFTDAEEAAVGLVEEMPFSLQQRLIAQGGKFESGPNFEPKIVRDGNLVTGQNPPSSGPAADEILRMLAR